MTPKEVLEKYGLIVSTRPTWRESPRYMRTMP